MTTTQEELCIAAVTELLGKHFHASMRYGQLRTGGCDPRSSTAYAEVQAVKDQITATVRPRVDIKLSDCVLERTESWCGEMILRAIAKQKEQNHG